MRYVVLVLVYLIIVSYVVHRRELKRYGMAVFEDSLKLIIAVHAIIALIIALIRFIYLNW